eukprot:Ihof_evm4s849 gene=Ihof_evmTU4s849
MFGQKQDSKITVNCSMTANDFFTRYSNLRAFLLDCLKIIPNYLVAPTVFPVLSILSALLPPPINTELDDK